MGACRGTFGRAFWFRLNFNRNAGAPRSVKFRVTQCSGDIQCPVIDCPDIHYPGVHCPDIHCPDIHCPLSSRSFVRTYNKNCCSNSLLLTFIVRTFIVRSFIVRTFIVRAFIVRAFIVRTFIIQTFNVRTLIVRTFIVRAFTVRTFIVRTVRTFIVRAFIVRAFIVHLSGHLTSFLISRRRSKPQCGSDNLCNPFARSAGIFRNPVSCEMRLASLS